VQVLKRQERERRRAGRANVRVVTRGSWQYVLVLGGRSKYGTDAARQGRGDAGPADEEEEEQQHEVVEVETAARF
jgi:hypothetical protein